MWLRPRRRAAMRSLCSIAVSTARSSSRISKSCVATATATSPVQLIDVRDLAEWMVRILEAGAAGVFNATGPDHPLNMGQLLEECRAVTDNRAQLTWVDEAFLLGKQVTPWSELPLWI